MPRSPKGVRLSVVCSTVVAPGGEFEALDLGAGGDAEDSGEERSVVLTGVSILPRVARAVTGFGEVAGIRRLSVFV